MFVCIWFNVPSNTSDHIRTVPVWSRGCYIHHDSVSSLEWHIKDKEVELKEVRSYFSSNGSTSHSTTLYILVIFAQEKKLSCRYQVYIHLGDSLKTHTNIILNTSVCNITGSKNLGKIFVLCCCSKNIIETVFLEQQHNTNIFP